MNPGSPGVPGVHEVPEKTLLALAAGGGGASAADLLLRSQYSKRLLLLRGVLGAAGPAAVRAHGLLARIQDADPRAVDAVLRYPTVGEWARRTLAEPGAARPGEYAALAAAAAVRAGFRAEIEVPARSGSVVLPGLGRAPVPGRASALVRTGPGGAEITAGDVRTRLPADVHEDAPGWEALRRLTASHRGAAVAFLLDDHDPDRMPGGERLPHRLPADELESWRSTLADAWRILVDHHRPAAEEVAALITVLTPLAPPARGMSSASSRDVFGSVALSSPPDAAHFAVTLVHEVQHAKLAALLDLVRLTRPDDGSTYYAPWREDPRPTAGLLQGAYAHLAIAAFWRTQRRHEEGAAALRAGGDFARWRAATEYVIRTLAGSGRLTPEGALFVDEMGRTVRAWLDEPVPDEALRRARDIAARHLAAWRRRNGGSGDRG
ncbi:HEXXH motif domain-containing protein [Actinomadura chibensis]|uniref:HEXXH motif domain-containing protein n=1 Tax=Actinomadura chibensis TaxID=392828 RepID=A0A5D0NLF8_9ACTN|nr:HEXXH motif domain-containing protein [Actinomadura chibensis]TYB45282.1 HEXXH motif domain-containing protein [Actinomadura chibensis]